MNLILVSSCLIGQRVRYDGGDSLFPHDILNSWQQQQRLVPICPEMSGGLPCPRPPAEIQGGQGAEVIAGSRQVLTNSGEDVTKQFVKGAKVALQLCQKLDIKMAIMKARSPSCGSQSSYDGSFSSTLVDGQGVTAALLESAGIRVFDETNLANAEAYLALLEANNP